MKPGIRRRLKKICSYKPAPRNRLAGLRHLTFVSKSTFCPVPTGSQIGDIWHTHRGWPVYGASSHVTVLTTINGHNGVLSVFRRPSRGWARHVRNRKANSK